MSGFDFLALVLQISNSFDFFKVLFSLIFTVNKGDIQLMALGSSCPTVVFSKLRNFVSVRFSSATGWTCQDLASYF